MEPARVVDGSLERFGRLSVALKDGAPRAMSFFLRQTLVRGTEDAVLEVYDEETGERTVYVLNDETGDAWVHWEGGKMHYDEGVFQDGSPEQRARFVRTRSGKALELWRLDAKAMDAALEEVARCQPAVLEAWLARKHPSVTWCSWASAPERRVRSAHPPPDFAYGWSFRLGSSPSCPIRPSA